MARRSWLTYRVFPIITRSVPCACFRAERPTVTDPSSEIVGGVKNNKNLGVTDQCLMLFGNGDGGGGPTPTMLEKVSASTWRYDQKLTRQLDRLSSLSVTNPEVPSIKVGSPIEFFDDLCERTDGGKRLPTWHGELYLELHRGVSDAHAQGWALLTSRPIQPSLSSSKGTEIWRPCYAT